LTGAQRNCQRLLNHGRLLLKRGGMNELLFSLSTRWPCVSHENPLQPQHRPKLRHVRLDNPRRCGRRRRIAWPERRPARTLSSERRGEGPAKRGVNASRLRSFLHHPYCREADNGSRLLPEPTACSSRDALWPMRLRRSSRTSRAAPPPFRAR